MTQLQEAVAQVFAPQGGLALAEPAFTPRPGQTRMALAVAGAIEEGQVLVGRYRIQGELGKGGMGIVFENLSQHPVNDLSNYSAFLS